MSDKIKRLKKSLNTNEATVFFTLLFIIVLFSVINNYFFSLRNLFDLMRTMTIYMIFASGIMMVIINGGIDMSFIANAMCASYIIVKLALRYNYSGGIMLFLLGSLLLGLIIGFCNSLLINIFEMPAFIITLATANVIRGLTLNFVGNNHLIVSDLSPAIVEFSRMFLIRAVDSTSGASFGLDACFFIALATMIITHFILRYTIIGRGVYALGGDQVSASRIGYDLKKVRAFIFSYVGALSGLGGMIYVIQTRMADPMQMTGTELNVVAAVVIGGVKITGGKGSVIGVFMGLMLTQVILTNLFMIGVPSYWQRLVYGCFVVMAIIYQTLQERSRAKKI